MILKPKRIASAFSLVEVLLVLVILAFMAKQMGTAIVASWFEQTDYERLSRYQHNLANALTLARQYAVQAQQDVALCGGNYEDKLCDGDWSQGWYIQLANKIKTRQRFPEDVKISWSGFPANKHFIAFYSNGHSGYQNGTFYLCLNHLMTRIVLNQSGRFYLSDMSALTDNDRSCE